MTRSRRPSGDHAKPSTPRGRSVRRRASPPSSGSRWTWLPSSRSFGSFGASGSSSTWSRRSEMNATVWPSGEKRALRSCFDADRQLARPAGSLERHEPDGVAIAVVPRRGRLERDERQCAVRREPRVGRDAQAVQVVGGERTRQAESSGCQAPARVGLRASDDPESSGYHRTTMRDQLSLRLEPDVPTLPNLPVTLRPMLARPLPEPFDSTAHLFEPSWGGLRALAFVGPAESAGAGDVRLFDGDGRDLTAALPELAGLAVRIDARSAVLDGELVVVGRQRPAPMRPSSTAGWLANAAGRSRSSRSTSSISTGGRCSRPRSTGGARRFAVSCGRATRWSRCPRSRARAGRSTTRPRPRGSPGSWPASDRARTCRASGAGSGGSSRSGRTPPAADGRSTEGESLRTDDIDGTGRCVDPAAAAAVRG